VVEIGGLVEFSGLIDGILPGIYKMVLLLL